MAYEPVEILLVEDNPTDAELTLHVLTEKHLINHIQIVHDGVEALEFLFARGTYAQRDIQNHPRVILLDLKLPKLDGLDVLRAIRGNPDTEFIPVVMLTSSRHECDIVESYHLGVNSYIVKPVNFKQFVEVVRNLGLYWVLLNQPPEPVSS